ncbi:MAG: noncanonical pyrimidine nucleotidase, YjjG family [Bacteroidales bacterium]|nr:MAG: noncanonical pyrimidine nucleotidase, YjjG family [Bacteroidales bacterium]
MFNGLFSKKVKVYKHIFFDLDRTLWDFDQNMIDALRDIFFDFNLDSIFPDIHTFINVFTKHNDYLWEKYRLGELKKDLLRFKRFDMTLRDYGVNEPLISKKMGEEFIRIIPLKTALVPHAREVLEYLKPKYKLHIITNGFDEVQFPKLEKCHLANFFEKVVTSETSGYHKPCPEAFGYSLSSVNAKKEESIMVGDDLEIDIVGAKKFGMDQIYFNRYSISHKTKPTHEINSLMEIKKIL